jgi:hypothetical protein
MITRLSDIAEKEYERIIQRLVEQKFKTIRGRTNATTPWIDDVYHPEQHDDLQQRVLQALRCRRWFEYEAPPWAQPLPLSWEDCYARYQGLNRGSQRGYLVGRYGILLRGAGWEWKNVPPFEMHCAQLLVPSP